MSTCNPGLFFGRRQRFGSRTGTHIAAVRAQNPGGLLLLAIRIFRKRDVVVGSVNPPSRSVANYNDRVSSENHIIRAPLPPPPPPPPHTRGFLYYIQSPIRSDRYDASARIRINGNADRRKKTHTDQYMTRTCAIRNSTKRAGGDSKKRVTGVQMSASSTRRAYVHIFFTPNPYRCERSLPRVDGPKRS